MFHEAQDGREETSQGCVINCLVPNATNLHGLGVEDILTRLFPMFQFLIDVHAKQRPKKNMIPLELELPFVLSSSYLPPKKIMYLNENTSLHSF